MSQLKGLLKEFNWNRCLSGKVDRRYSPYCCDEGTRSLEIYAVISDARVCLLYLIS